MTNWLILTLAAPMAAHGGLAGVERRGSAARPSKSQLLGLLGAALGLDRTDDDGQRALAAEARVAFRLYAQASSGRALNVPIQDFHTSQTVAARKGFHPRTRSHALAEGDVHTMISRRDYLCDVLADAAIAPGDGARWDAHALAAALRDPAFTLAFGRKSCPFALPLNPRVVTAMDAEAAFRAGDQAENEAVRTLRESAGCGGSPTFIAVEADDPSTSRLNRPARRERRWDEPVDRRKWHFAPRYEALIPWRADPEPEL